MFVRVWVNIRHLFTGRNHDSAFARMHIDLLQHSINWDVPTLTKRRWNLLDQYKKREKSGKLMDWDLYKPLAVILGNAAPESLHGTDWLLDSSGDKVVDLAVFTKGRFVQVSIVKVVLNFGLD